MDKDYIPITEYTNVNGQNVIISFDQKAQLLINNTDGVETIMGRPENFLPPYNKGVEFMKSKNAIAVALFCRNWIASRNENNS